MPGSTRSGEELRADFLIVGAGLAGHRAALEASALGAKVLLIEKMPEAGGSSAMSGGSFAFAGTDHQRRFGIMEDGPERLRADLLEVGGNHNDPALVDVYVDHQLGEYDYLRKHGVEFSPIQLSSGQSVPRSHPSNPRGVLDKLRAELDQRDNVQILLNTKATKILRNDRFEAIEATQDGKPVTIHGDKGILLATGGFSRSEDLLQLFAPETRRGLRAGGLGNEGDGLKMAWEHGAGFADLGYVKGTFGSYIESYTAEPHTILLPVYRGAVAVNKSGIRFVKESLSYKKLGQACLEEEDARAYQIFDEKIMAASVDGVPSFDFQAALRKKRIFKADSLAALSAMIGVDEQRLTDTVARYNAAVRDGGEDDLGREYLSHRSGTLVEISAAPFYAYPCTTVINTTYAGLKIREDMSVLNVWGAPLRGLYGAGELVGGFHGEAYMTGTSLVKALIGGKLAAQAALS